jgi:hypothetical protein
MKCNAKINCDTEKNKNDHFMFQPYTVSAKKEGNRKGKIVVPVCKKCIGNIKLKKLIKVVGLNLIFSAIAILVSALLFFITKSAYGMVLLLAILYFLWNIIKEIFEMARYGSCIEPIDQIDFALNMYKEHGKFRKEFVTELFTEERKYVTDEGEILFEKYDEMILSRKTKV